MPAQLATADSINTAPTPYVGVHFPLQGHRLPADHGFLPYSAISKSSSSLHGIDWLAIELISGFPSGRGLIALSDRDATLRLRIPADHYRDVLPLAGKRLDIGGHQIRLGLPVARPLEPAPSLYSRVVTIKKFTEAEPFLEAVERKLDSFGVKGRVELPRDEQGRYRRRIVTIHGKSVVGFSVALRMVVTWVQRLPAITEYPDLTPSKATFSLLNAFMRPNQNIAANKVASREKGCEMVNLTVNSKITLDLKGRRGVACASGSIDKARARFSRGPNSS
jgi:CRISPR-associated endonuclease/helicase Cas3